MLYFILVCVIAFVLVVLLVNFPKFKEKFKNREKPVKAEKTNTSSVISEKDTASRLYKDFWDPAPVAEVLVVTKTHSVNEKYGVFQIAL